MEFVVAHELPGRIRLRTPKGTFSKKNAPAVEALLESQRGVKKVKASYLTGSILICFEVSCREGVLSAAALMTRDYYDDEELEGLRGEAPQESLKAGLAAMAARTLFRLLLLVCLDLLLAGDISGAVLSRVYDSENFYNYILNEVV